jgi:uncharacterized repeat protein (TIGR01451 family)
MCLLVIAAWAASAAADDPPWIAAVESDGIVFFAIQSPPSVERYDLASHSWLEPIELDAEPTAFHADSDGLYISFGRRTVRFDRNGGNETHLRNTNYDATEIFTYDGFIYVYDGETLVSVDWETGAKIDDAVFWYEIDGFAVASGLGAVFAVYKWVSPADIVRVELLADGEIGELEESPHHGAYFIGSAAHVFPDETTVSTDGGVVYATGELTYAGSLAGVYQDIAFTGDRPFIIRDGLILEYSENLLRVAEYEPFRRPLKIVVEGSDIVSFFQAQDDLEAEIIPLAVFVPRATAGPMDPAGLSFEPDLVLPGPAGQVLMLSSEHQQVFRWSIDQNDYLAQIPLTGGPSHMAYSATNEALYLGYEGGEITRVEFDPGGVPGIEEPFVNLPADVLGLAAADEYLFACDPTAPWESHHTFTPDGAAISQVDWNYFSFEYVWSSVNRKMYFLRDDTSPNDLLWEEIHEDGAIGSSFDSPYHSSDGIQHPVRVRPDGGVVLLGSGRIYDAHSLEQVDTLSNDIDDAVWLDGDLFTVRVLDGAGELQAWGLNYGIDASRFVHGQPIRLLSAGSSMVLVAQRNGKPWFSTWDAELDGEGFSVSVTSEITQSNGFAEIEYTIIVSNLGPTAASGVHVEDRFPETLGDVTWTCDATENSSCTAGPTGGDIIDTIDLGVDGEVTYTARARIWARALRTTVNRCEVFETGGTVYWDTDRTITRPSGPRTVPFSNRRGP